MGGRGLGVTWFVLASGAESETVYFLLCSIVPYIVQIRWQVEFINNNNII